MKISKHIKNKGFALISTLSIMSLLVMLAIGMMSMATTESKVANATKYEMEAKANARMALMIALGELQEAMGPDQRISATSNILDTSPESDSVEGVVSQNVLGVWDSWNTYITDPLDSSHPSAPGMTIQQSYVEGRAPLFKKWLVSHDKDAELKQWEAVKDGFKFSEKALMVGEGSMGSDTEEESYVQAGKIPTTDASGNETGAYAWWVGGENMKADLGIARDRATIESNDGLAAIQTSNAALDLIDPSESDGFEGFTEDVKDRAKMISAGQIGLETSDRQLAKGRFFDFTTGTKSVLADVRKGGAKWDLNLLFEAETMPSEYGVKSLPWNSNVTADATIRELDGVIASKGGDLVNDHTSLPSWRVMRDYYQLYRSADDYGVQWQNKIPYTKRTMQTELSAAIGNGARVAKLEQEGYTRLPLILRQSYLLGLKKAPSQADPNNVTVYSMVTIPVTTLWNPYNVEMRFQPDEFVGNVDFEQVVRLGYKLHNVQNSGDISNENGQFNKSPHNDSYWRELNVNAGRSHTGGPGNTTMLGVKYRGFSNSPAAEIVMEPGEIVMFSVGEGTLPYNEAYRGLLNNPEDPLLGFPLGIVMARNNAQISPQISIALANESASTPIANKQELDRFGSSYTAFGFFLKHTTQFTSNDTVTDDESGVEIQTGNQKYSVSGLITNWHNAGDQEGNAPEIIPVSQPRDWPSSSNEINWIAIVECVAKTAEPFQGYSDGAPAYASKDYRVRNWLHAPLQNVTNVMNVGNDIARANSPYTVHYEELFGLGGFGTVLQYDTDGRAYGGAGISSGVGVSNVVTQELPTAPITNLSGFATMRLRPATVHALDTSDVEGPWSTWWKQGSHHSAAFGMGIGNGYAHPMIPANDVLQSFSGGEWTDLNTFTTSKSASNQSVNDKVANDYWDQLLITNDALYDNWFCSAVVPETDEGRETKGLAAVLSDFLDGKDSLVNQRYHAYVPEGMTVDDVKGELLESGGGVTSEAYKKIGAFMTLEGGFNVNSTSVDAWKAMLTGLQKRHQIVYGSDNGSVNVDDGGSDEMILSRFGWAPTNGEGDTAVGDSESWRGIRKLSTAQISKLAEEIVHQVKARGPFLNMSEFINRRITDEKEPQSQAGALQAAIDWGEYANDYNGSGSSDDTSINGIYKGAGDMITTPVAEFPNSTSAKGSRYAGIPGYVMASDVLKALGDTLVVRDDTFTIRGYGESRDAQGEVKAKVWCEAVVQRMPDYVDSSESGNDPWEQRYNKLGADADGKGLTEENQKYGRKIRIVSFRWLSPSEV